MYIYIQLVAYSNITHPLTDRVDERQVDAQLRGRPQQPVPVAPPAAVLQRRRGAQDPRAQGGAGQLSRPGLRLRAGSVPGLGAAAAEQHCADY